MDITNLKNNIIDLKDTSEVVTITGHYKGDRIILKNADNKTIFLRDGSIESTHPEDALCFYNGIKNTKIYSDNFVITGGAVSFWGESENILLQGFSIMFAHTGIRSIGHWNNKNISIYQCKLYGIKHEGIYWGYHSKIDQMTSNIKIENCEIICTGWDGIQVGNCKVAEIYNNTINHTGLRDTKYQKHAITINPNSIVFEYNNNVSNYKHKIQVLDSRYFNQIK